MVQKQESTVPTRSLDFGKSLTYMFEEPEWGKKFLIGVGLILLAFPLVFLGVIPALIPAFIVTGYSMEISRRYAQNQAVVLPEWSDWGKFLKDGALFALAGIIYALPLIIPIICLAASIIATADASGEVGGIVALITFAFVCVTMLYIIPLYIFLYGGLIEYLRTGEFSAFFRFRNMSALKSAQDGNPRKHFALVLLMILIPLGMAGGAIPFLGTIWALYVQGHLLGQVLHETGYELSASPPPGMVSMS
jgi:hypothetical protein